MNSHSFKLSRASLEKLVGVDARLVAVIKRAIDLSAVDFRVLEGVRSRDQCARNWGKGRTVDQCRLANVPQEYARPHEPKVTKLRDPYASRHVTGHAVDLLPLPVDWNDLGAFREVARAVQAASEELGIPVSSGANWRSFPDYPHHELPK